MPPTELPKAPDSVARTWSQPLRWLMVPWTIAIFYPFVLVSTFVWGSISVLLSLISQRVGFYGGVYWARSLTWTSFVRVKIEGREHAPQDTSYVILANHQGAYDILALYGFLGRQFRWVIKEELRKVPFLGWGCAAIGHIFVDRSNSRRAFASLQAAKPRLTGGVSVLFFPEGTRSEDGRLGRFKKGGFVMARQLGFPILPLSISGASTILPKGCHFPRPGSIRITLHPPVDTKGFADDAALIDQVRATIASGLSPEER
jgi:1-acyl-sn-glycerol-3-phosphate acyltransferase